MKSEKGILLIDALLALVIVLLLTALISGLVNSYYHFWQVLQDKEGKLNETEARFDTD